MQFKQPLAEAHSGRHALVNDEGRRFGQRAAAFGADQDVAGIAHEVERGQIAQHVGQPAQRGAGLLPGFGLAVAAGAKGDEVVELVGLPGSCRFGRGCS